MWRLQASQLRIDQDFDDNIQVDQDIGIKCTMKRWDRNMSGHEGHKEVRGEKVGLMGTSRQKRVIVVQMGLWAGAKGMSKIFWPWECFFLIWRFKFFVKLYQMLIKDNCLCIGSDWSCTFPPKIGNTFCNIYIIKECFCTEIKNLKREVNAWRDKSRNNIIFIQQKYMMRSKNLEKF